MLDVIQKESVDRKHRSYIQVETCIRLLFSTVHITTDIASQNLFSNSPKLE